MSPKVESMRGKQPPSMVTQLKRRPDGSHRVVLPEGTVSWRLGQRVWFQARLGRIEVSTKPQGRRGDRRHTGRIRRGFKSLRTDG
jgi:hypothetical protein